MTWETNIVCESEVEVYLSKRLRTDGIPDKLVGRFLGNMGSIHKVKITGLEPFTDYHYKVIARLDKVRLSVNLIH